MIWERNGGNITFISKRKEYDCNYFYLLISRIIRMSCRRDGCGAGWKNYVILKAEKEFQGDLLFPRARQSMFIFV